MLERRKDEALAGTAATIRNMAADNGVGPILRRQAHAMQKIQSSFEPLMLFPVEAVPEPPAPALLPDFSGSNRRRLESAVLDLLPKTAEQVEEAERMAVEAAADPENRKDPGEHRRPPARPRRDRKDGSLGGVPGGSGIPG
jgi:hypothetical protein